MIRRSEARLIVVFVVAVSLLSLQARSGVILLPHIQLGHAMFQSCDTSNPPGSCSEYWIPAGPAMNTYAATIFTDAQAEYVNMESQSPSIDFTDSPISALDLSTFTQGSNFKVTQPIQTGVSEIEFNLANNFWGCQFYFGDWNQTGQFPGSCGVEIRQGIAHLIDKSTFAADEPTLQGLAQAVDNPLPASNGGLPFPNPCSWDASHSETGPNCVVGSVGGTAYHIGAAGGVNYPWQPAYGSADFCAAADHFVAAGLAASKDKNCVLKGIQSYVTNHPVNFFVRNDILALSDLGKSLAQEICALFGQGFQWPCPAYLTVTLGPFGAFPGYITQTNQVNRNWGVYTSGAGFGGYMANPFEEVLEHLDEISGIDPFDSGLYWVYNSQFVSNVPNWDSGLCSLSASNAGICPQGANLPCSQSARPSLNPANYMYLCDPTFDSFGNQMEYAPCISASGDPTVGQTTPTFANCPGTSQMTGISAGYKAEDRYGKSAYSIPIYTLGVETAYLSNWLRVINADGAGSNNFFTGLNAWTFSPAIPYTIREGLSTTTSSTNPYIASTPYDFLILSNIFDTLGNADPLSNSQYFGALASSVQEIPNSSLTYTPPAGTVETFRFSLRNDAFFQNGQDKVTAFDVAFSYLSLVGSGSFDGAGAGKMTGVTVLGPSQVDISIGNPYGNNNSVSGIFDTLALTSLFILPGSQWSNAGALAWRSEMSTCTATNAPCYPAQYTLGSPSTTTNCALTCLFSTALMNVNTAAANSVSYDPVFEKTLIGSGPWECYNPVSGIQLGGGCSSTFRQDPPVDGSYVLTRFGACCAPASSVSGDYFRSNGNLALYLWSEDTGDITHDFLIFSSVASCVGSTSQSCGHWMMGIGGCGATSSTTCNISASQVGIVSRFVGLDWASMWSGNPPVGMRSLPTVLNEGQYFLFPASTAGCASQFNPQSQNSGGYDC